jgi:DNA-binding MarR family transcriptional regulator
MSNTSNSSTSRSLDFCLSLAKAHAALVRRFDGRLGTLHGVSFSDFILLLQLSRAPGERLRRVDLAEKLGLTASAVTRALIPLERIGLVKRQHDLHDARVGYAVITKSGQRILQEAMSSAELVSEEALGAKHESQLNPLSELLVQIGA